MGEPVLALGFFKTTMLLPSFLDDETILTTRLKFFFRLSHF